MLSLLRRRNFGLLWFGGLISMIGDWMLRIALPVHVYQLTGSTLATGLMFIAQTLPNLILSSIAGVYVDRWNRRRTMIISNFLLAVAILPMIGVRDTSWLWLVYLAGFLESAIGQFVNPAENALLPQLVGEQDLPTANALNSLNNNLARLIGPAVGGLLAATFSLGGVVLIDAATYLVAATLLLLMSNVVETHTIKDEDTPKQGVWRELREGVGVIRQNPVLTVLFSMIALMSFGEGVLGVMFVPFVTKALGGTALQLGWLMSAQAIGGLAGSACIGWVGRRISPERLLAPCCLLFGLIDLAMFVYPAFVRAFLPALVLITIVGIPAVGSGTSFNTLLQTGVADRFRGRVFGAFGTVGALIGLLGMGFASGFGDVVDVVPMVSIQGIMPILAGLLALRLPFVMRPSQPLADDAVGLA